jgi:hypothetical protein
VECIEACLDDILALGLGDALCDREGARRMGEGFGTPWAIARGMGGRGRGLGHPGRSRGHSEVGGRTGRSREELQIEGGDWDDLHVREGNRRMGEGTQRTGEGIRTPAAIARGTGGRERGDSDAPGDHEGTRTGRGLGHPGQFEGTWRTGEGNGTLVAIMRGLGGRGRGDEDAQGNHEGNRRTGQWFGKPWTITRGMGGRGRGLGRSGRSHGDGDWEVEGGDSDAQCDHEGTRRTGEAIVRPGEATRGVGDERGVRGGDEGERIDETDLTKSIVWLCFHWFIGTSSTSSRWSRPMPLITKI